MAPAWACLCFRDRLCEPWQCGGKYYGWARYDYLLLWVLVVANVSAMRIQYLSAKLGIITGESLPWLLGKRLERGARLTYWAQAEIIAATTDLAVVLGGAIALNLLLGLPLLWGGVIVSAISLLLVALQNRGSQRGFEGVIVALVLIITCGFLAGLIYSPPSPAEMAAGLVPSLVDPDSLVIAKSILGATVMPHAIYLHSSLVIHHERSKPEGSLTTPCPHARSAKLLRATRIDIVWALSLAGLVNIGLLLLAASSLEAFQGIDTIEGAHAVITTHFGTGVGVVFAIGLLASGLASTSLGTYAGSEIMKGLLHIHLPLLLRRAITIIPALTILGARIDPTWALVLSQIFLSLGIPMALVPLMRLSADVHIMGAHKNTRTVRWLSFFIAGGIIISNIALLYIGRVYVI